MADENNQNVRLNKRDEMMGRFLSEEVNKGEKTACPSLEYIAALIDGKLNQDEKDMVMLHLSSCSECYEVFSETVRIQETAQRSKVNIRRALHYFVPAAVAAAAVLLLIIKFVTPRPDQTQMIAEIEKSKQKQEEIIIKDKKVSPDKIPAADEHKKYVLPSSVDMAVMLARNADLKSLAGSFKEYTQTSYGFAGLSEESVFFRTGVYLTDLEIALKAEEKDKSVEAIGNLIGMLQSIEGSSEIVAFYADVKQKIERGASPGQYAGKGKTENYLKENDAFIYLQFGEWVEGGRLAAIANNRSFFEINAIQYFIGNIKDKDLDSGISNALKEIEDIIGKGSLDDQGFMRIEKALSTISDIM